MVVVVVEIAAIVAHDSPQCCGDRERHVIVNPVENCTWEILRGRNFCRCHDLNYHTQRFSSMQGFLYMAFLHTFRKVLRHQMLKRFRLSRCQRL